MRLLDLDDVWRVGVVCAQPKSQDTICSLFVEHPILVCDTTKDACVLVVLLDKRFRSESWQFVEEVDIVHDKVAVVGRSLDVSLMSG